MLDFRILIFKSEETKKLSVPPINKVTLVDQIKGRVRSSLKERFSLEDFAQELGLSAVRVHQIFASQHGENFGEFCRRVRIEHACALMRAFPEWSCTRVAFEAGFSESSDFSRSFKRQYGISPNQWDRVIPLAKLLKKRQDAEQTSCASAKVGFPDEYSGDYAPVAIRRRAKERVVVLSVKKAESPDTLRKAFDTLEKWLVARNQRSPDRRFMGMSFDSTLDTPPDVYRFELAHPVDEAILGEGAYRIIELPDCDVATVPCRGGTAQFIAAWDYLLRGFIPNSGWREGPGPHLEIYYNDPRKYDMRYWDMDCVVRLSGKEREKND